jgi:hypothetical protein
MSPQFNEPLTLSREEVVYSPHRDRRNAMILIWSTLGSLVVSFIFVFSYGQPFRTAGFVTGIFLVVVTVYRVDWGFSLLILTSLVFGQFEVPGFQTLTIQVSYFRNLKEVSYLPYTRFGDLSLFEIHLLLVMFTWVTLLALNKKAKAQPVSLWFSAVLWFAWVVISFGLGLQQGGEMLPALWETRAIMYMGVLLFFVPQVIHEKKQIQTLMWVSIIGITEKALEGVSRYIGNGWSTANYEALQAHEDPLFIGVLIIFLLALSVFGGHRGQRRTLLLLLFPLLLGFWAGQRRASYAALIASMIAFIVLLPTPDLRRITKYVIPASVLLIVYVAVFWNSGSSLASPLRQIKSGIEKDDETAEVVKDQDYYSNLYRLIEDYNLAVTVQNSPLLGIGFGTKYEQPMELAMLHFALRDFMAHNNVIWLLAKVGAVGFFLFWLLLNLFALKGGALMYRLRDPYLKSICSIVVVAIINLIIGAYFDLHLVRYRTMIFTGTLMGLMVVIERIDRESSIEDAKEL